MSRTHRKLVRVLLYALVALVLTNLLAGWLRLKHYQPRSTVWNPETFLYQRSDHTADILILGDSAARWGVRTKYIDETLASRGLEGTRTLSAAQPSSHIVHDALLLGELVATNGCPRVVALEVCATSLSQQYRWWRSLEDYVSLRDLFWVLPMTRKLEPLNALLAAPLAGLTRLFDYAVYPPSEAFLENQTALWHKEPEAQPATGGAERPGRPAPAPEDTPAGPIPREISTQDLSPGPHELGEVAERALARIERLTDRCGANLLLFYVPRRVSVARRRPSSPRVELERSIAEFAAGRDITLVDSAEADLPLTWEHFRDPVHLRQDGAALFSTYLARNHLEPLIRRRRDSRPVAQSPGAHTP